MKLSKTMRKIMRLTVRGRICTMADFTIALPGISEASISARLRDLRKAQYGGHDVWRVHMGKGKWGYRIIRRRRPK